MNRRKLIFVSILSVLVLGGAGGFYWLGNGTGKASFRTTPVERGDIQSTISATGTLNAVITVQVGTQVSGTISQLLVDYNSPVKKGMLIARIDPPTFEAKVNQAKGDLESARAAVLNQRAAVVKAEADVATARANVVRQDVALRDAKVKADARARLYQEGGISQEERDSAQATLESAQAQLDAAQASLRASQAALEVTRAQLTSAEATVQQKEAALAQAQVDLNNTFIRAPVDGVVVSRNVDVGQTVAASLQAPTLFTIAQDLKKMQVDTNVAEADVGKLSAGTPTTFSVDAFPGETFKGTIRQIRNAPQTLQNVVTYDAVIDVDNHDLKLRPGMTANVTFIYAEKNDALKIPNAALRFRPPPEIAAAAPRPSPDHRTVWVLNGGHPKPITIRSGLSDGTVTEAVEGDLHEEMP